MPSRKTAELEAAVSALEAARSSGYLPDHLQERISVLASARSSVRSTCGRGSINPEPSVIPRAPRLPNIRTSQPPEMKGFVETLKLEEEFTAAVETQKAFGLLKAGEKMPHFGQVLNAFTPQMLAAACNFRDPKLILTTKGRSFKDLISAINNHGHMPLPCDVDNVFEYHSFQRAQQWGAHIIGRGYDRGFPDNPFEQRLEDFADQKEGTGIGGMDRWKFSHFMMRDMLDSPDTSEQVFHRGQSMIVLDEDPALTRRQVPVAHWRPEGRLRNANFLYWDLNHHTNSLCEFYPSVGGNIPDSNR